jgi:hypothetical protein
MTSELPALDAILRAAAAPNGLFWWPWLGSITDVDSIFFDLAFTKSFKSISFRPIIG